MKVEIVKDNIYNNFEVYRFDTDELLGCYDTFEELDNACILNDWECN